MEIIFAACLIEVNRIKRFTANEVEEILKHHYLAISAKCSISNIHALSDQIRLIEREVKKHVKLRPEYKCLTTTPGIGEILSFTIMLEVGDINRFPKAGNYASYCRCVKSERLSNDKKMGLAFCMTCNRLDPDGCLVQIKKPIKEK